MKKPRLTDVLGHQSHTVHCPAWEKWRGWHGLHGGEGLGLGGSELAQGHWVQFVNPPAVRDLPVFFGYKVNQRLLCQGRWGPKPRGGRRGCTARNRRVRPGWVIAAGAWRAGRGRRGAEPAAGGAVPRLPAAVAAVEGSWRERAQRR